jgi:hypothetical protein
MSIPKKVQDRFGARIKQFQAILEVQRSRDVSEADTVTVIKDMLCEIFGYDKYSELTSEHLIRGTYCDLAIKLDGKLVLLIEVKSIGTDLRENHVKQAVDYAANQGCEWVVLTNGIDWQLYHITFGKPIEKKLVANLNFLSLSPRKDQDCEHLYILTREGFGRNALAEFRDRKEATSRYMLAAVTLSEPIIAAIRRELRRVSDVLVDTALLEKMMREEVLKRDVIEGDDAASAAKRVNRKVVRSVQAKPSRDEQAMSESPEPVATPQEA